MQADFRHLASALSHLSADELADVRKAFDFAVKAHHGQKREDGSPYVNHVIRVAGILAGWGADRDTAVAALLHDVLEDTPVQKEEIIALFGRKVGLLVEGITKFSTADLDPDLPLERKVETLRKLFDVMRLDMRSILIKLADRLDNVMTIDLLPTVERRKKFAVETLSVYYKIAFHLGMREVRRTFAEFCVPHVFDTGAAERERRDALFKINAGIPSLIEKELRKHGEASEIVSVKAQKRNLLIFHERSEKREGNTIAQDAFSVSIIVRTEDDCYHVLKTLHTLYRPVTGQFRDFIAAPSDAGYQSLHTYVSLPEGTVIEARIRTPEMYEQAMRGATLFMFGSSRPSQHFAWLEKTEALDLKTRDSSSAFWEALESDILRETISVLVDRKRISLPKGATALDAAYALHNQKAGNTRSLTVNGRTALGSQILKEDDDIHVVMNQRHHVTFEWLQMVSTRHARLLIVEVLKKTEKSEKIALGAALLQKELDHYNKGLISELSRTQCQSAADHFRRESFDQVLSMIGEGVIRARDVVFFLFPDRTRALIPRRSSDTYAFQIAINAGPQSGQDVLSQLEGVVRLSDITIHNVQMKANPRPMAEIFVSGTSADRLQFADFIDSLERQEWVSSVRTLLPRHQKMFLLGLFVFSFAVILLDIILYPGYQSALGNLSFIPSFIVQALPLLPILMVNYYLLGQLRHYVVRIRSDRWYLGIGLVLNIAGLLLLVLRILMTTGIKSSLLPLIALFVLSLAYTGVRFLKADTLLASVEDKYNKPLKEADWKKLQKQKKIGYGIRLLAVFIWGIEPIYIRYTAVNDLSPFLRTFLLGLGVLLPTGLIYIVKHLVQRRRWPSFSMPYSSTFLVLLIGQVGYMYLLNASLIHTSGTNLLLFNNFSPLIGLIVAAFFWRRDIPYFRQPRTMLAIFLLAIFAGLGSSLLVYNNVLLSRSWSVLGDALAILSTFFDALLVIGQIEYIKRFPRTDGLLLNLHIFFFLLVCTSPVIALAPLFGFNLLHGLTTMTLLLGLGTGLMVGFGQWLNYEAFKRIDGYLAYMMFNISVLITFMLEAFVIHSIQPTFLLLLSGAIIISASIFAEIINSRCQKQGL